jgi:O-antigen/teichoic acid export membrane protein
MSVIGDSPAVRGVARRASWGLLDQVMSSGSNFALSAFVAASVGATEFGAFTVAYAIYNLVLAFSAGLASVPLLVRYSASARERYQTATRASVGVALVVGTLAGLLCLAASPLTTPAVAGPLRALAVTLPGLLVQDTWRYSFVTGGQPAKAAGNDGLWIVLQFVGIAVLLAIGQVSALSMVLVWGGCGSAAAVFGCWQAGAVPAPRQVFTWLRDERAFTWRYAVEVVVNRSGTWVGLSLVGAMVGLQGLGALRGAMLILAGPLNLLFMGATFAFVSEGVRLAHRSPARLPAAIRAVSGVAAAIAIAWCTVVLLAPDGIGSRVLGATWHQAKPLFPTIALMMVALAAALGPVQGLLSLAAAKRSLFTQVAGLGLQVPLVAGSAALAGARGAAAGFAMTTLFRTAIAWGQFRRGFAEWTASADGVTTDRALLRTIPT